MGRLPTCYSPVRHFTKNPKVPFSFDLHVLSTPPAFVLSQDQTLQFKLEILSLVGQILKGYRLQLFRPEGLLKPVIDELKVDVPAEAVLSTRPILNACYPVFKERFRLVTAASPRLAVDGLEPRLR